MVSFSLSRYEKYITTIWQATCFDSAMKKNSDIMSRAISDSELEQLVFFLSELVYSSNDCTKTTCRMSFAGKSLH